MPVLAHLRTTGEIGRATNLQRLENRSRGGLYSVAPRRARFAFSEPLSVLQAKLLLVLPWSAATSTLPWLRPRRPANLLILFIQTHGKLQFDVAASFRLYLRQEDLPVVRAA